MYSLAQTTKVCDRLLEAFLIDFLDIKNYKAIVSDYASILQELIRFIYQEKVFEEIDGKKYVFIGLKSKKGKSHFSWQEKFPNYSHTTISKRLAKLK